MRLLTLAAVGLFALLGACGSSGTPSGGAGSGGTTGTGGNGGTSGAWICDQQGSACVCHLHTGVTAQDNCTTKPSCCDTSAVQGDTIDTCICNDLTGTGLTCAQLAAEGRGTVVATCPP